MARDPPPIVSSSELRDLSLEPTDVRPAHISIIHPQLRDLVLPLDRAHVLYPRGTIIEEQRWSPPEDNEPGPSKGVRNGTTRTFARLTFTPNCLTATGPIMACGGQHGELYMTNLPSRTASTASLNARFPSTPPPIRPFFISVVLPTMSINNSMIILPGWPAEWHRKERERKASFLRRHGPVDEEEESEEESYAPVDTFAEEDIDEEAMDMDDDEESHLESGSSSFATYPNTVPFLNPPRLPHLSPTTNSMDIPGSSRRAASFSTGYRPGRGSRASFLSSVERPGVPGIQYVSSRSPSFISSTGAGRRLSMASGKTTSSREQNRPMAIDEPRLLISNNDQTVKMFSLPTTEKTNSRSALTAAPQLSSLPAGQYVRSAQIPVTSAMRRTVSGNETGRNQEHAPFVHLPRLHAPVAPPRPRFGSSIGWDSISANEGLRRTQDYDSAELQREIERARAHLQLERESRRQTREEFERVVGMRVGLGSGAATSYISSSRPGHRSPGEDDWRARPVAVADRSGETEERKLAKIGGARLKCAVNHSSISPDLKTMVSVGDSSEVFLFEVIDGGREFKRIGTYNAATDSGFSTSWSKDGRKFAVASQDGQVTVWDHRSSKPLATFFTSHSSSTGSLPYSWDQTGSDNAAVTAEQLDLRYQANHTNVMLVDPVTGAPSTGASTSGREAARVVKFSPEGSCRDLMVFSEENSNIHIVDARTFHTHVVVPVPWRPASSATDTQRTDRKGVENGVTGIAGIAFDPSGDWLYSGTERTVVEWDMRRLGGGESATWQVA
ncbi:hypothetical protein BD324DRAFT_639736 [Kockovaella imperatae]|uniref:DUF2415 domain-containing protein n=1 Tax=Kockovaella imperatae TaxID=4999 RepID=A0A1Y1U7B9_9TREE|nr:hypothetical protein BD324DRAFT_639736 [Kockovaella imperatae]ORX33426.1 hypothetical protein BD324DRAFT_639736 [Kockovaella imperatae]